MASKVTMFRRVFDPEYLSARKDITPVMLAAAKGDYNFVVSHLEDGRMVEIHLRNKDGNTLLLLAAANKHAKLADYLCECKSDVVHKNRFQMDALEYACMESVRTPIAKVILSHCDFIIPDVIEGPYWGSSHKAIEQLREDGVVTARCGIIGKTPDFSYTVSNDAAPSDYRDDWLQSLKYLARTVKSGILLLDSDIGYLQHDAMLTGSLEVPTERRFVYMADKRKVVKFSTMLRVKWAETLEKRIIEACDRGDAIATQGLLKAKAHPNVEDARGQTLLMRASGRGSEEVLKCLLQAKANVNSTNKDGYPALLLAAVNEHETAVRMLIRSKANLGMQTFKGNRLVDFVKHRGQADMLKIFAEEREFAAQSREGNDKKATSAAIALR